MIHKLYLIVFAILSSMVLQAQNTISVINPPATVTAGQTIDFNVSYTKNVTAARVQLRFVSPTGDFLDFDVLTVSNNSDTVTLTLDTPVTIGENYSLQAQLLSMDWAGLAANNYDVTVENMASSGDNTLEIINTASTPINNGTLRPVTISYNLLQPSRILVEVRDSANVSGSSKIGQVWVDVPAGQDTVNVDLIVNNGFPGDTNRIQAVLFEANSWTPITMPYIPFILVDKGDGTITYRDQPYNYNNEQNLLFEEDLGNGYYTNWFVNNGWIGDIQAKFGSFEQEAWVDWDNNGHQPGQSHAEFDIKIQKFSWHNWKQPSVDRGYPTKIVDITNPLTSTYTGQWSPNSEGRTFFNMTAWLYSSEDISNSSNSRCDIIIHTWDNSGNLAQKYAANPNDSLEPLSTITSQGTEYHVLKRNVGGYGEAATYNLVPVNNPRAGHWNTPFETTAFNVSLSVKDILDKLIIVDGNSEYPVLDSQWYIHGLEWTFIGSSGDTIGGDYVQDSKGRFTLLNYTIPDLNANTLAIESAIYSPNNQMVTLYPNPFSDSFSYTINALAKDLIAIELFTLDGRRIEIIPDKSNTPLSNTISTSHLNSGIYLLKVSTTKGVSTKKLRKL